MSKLRLIFLILLLPFVFFSCKTDNPVPEVYVNFLIQLQSPYYFSLSVVGNSIIVPNEGYKEHGVIITRVGQDEFAAYDATCTYDPEDAWGRVEIDETGNFAVDTVCHSKYNLFFGIVELGPATIPLKIYNVDYNPNTNSILVHN